MEVFFIHRELSWSGRGGVQQKIMDTLLKRLGRSSEEGEEKKILSTQEQKSEKSQYQELKMTIHHRILTEMNLEQQQWLIKGGHDRKKVEEMISVYCNRVLDENPFALPRGERYALINDVIDEILGLGPLEPLLKDNTVTEIMVNGPKNIYVERAGKLHPTNIQFYDNAHLMNIIERILSPIGRRVDETSPLVDARLADGSRVNIIVPPLSLVGPCITIRKFSRDIISAENLIQYGTINENMKEFLKACIEARLNIIISGGTGSGKTTTLNVLSGFIPHDERIITIEDAAELKLEQEHVVTLEAKVPNIEGKGAVTIRDLVRNSLRMRPDRIIVGEVRSGEALDMLQAMNTGHDGSLTTIHANHPRDVLSRLETMVLMSGMDLPVRAIREQISSAIDLIIHQSRMRDGTRKITYITEVQKMEGDVITLQDLFRFRTEKIDTDGKVIGRYEATGLRPQFMEKFLVNGVSLPSMFPMQKDDTDPTADW